MPFCPVLAPNEYMSTCFHSCSYCDSKSFPDVVVPSAQWLLVEEDASTAKSDASRTLNVSSKISITLNFVHEYRDVVWFSVIGLLAQGSLLMRILSL